MTTFVVDSGPLVALLDRSDQYHDWAKSELAQIPCPVWTCEGAVAEAAHLLQNAGSPPWSVLELVSREVLTVSFELAIHWQRVMFLMRKYADRPMDFVDACLVTMMEAGPDRRLITVDSDFRFYRRFERHTIPLVAPF